MKIELEFQGLKELIKAFEILVSEPEWKAKVSNELELRKKNNIELLNNEIEVALRFLILINTISTAVDEQLIIFYDNEENGFLTEPVFDP